MKNDNEPVTTIKQNINSNSTRKRFKTQQTRPRNPAAVSESENEGVQNQHPCNCDELAKNIVDLLLPQVEVAAAPQTERQEIENWLSRFSNDEDIKEWLSKHKMEIQYLNYLNAYLLDIEGGLLNINEIYTQLNIFDPTNFPLTYPHPPPNKIKLLLWWFNLYSCGGRYNILSQLSKLSRLEDLNSELRIHNIVVEPAEPATLDDLDAQLDKKSKIISYINGINYYKNNLTLTNFQPDQVKINTLTVEQGIDAIEDRLKNVHSAMKTMKEIEHMLAVWPDPEGWPLDAHGLPDKHIVIHFLTHSYLYCLNFCLNPTTFHNPNMTGVKPNALYGVKSNNYDEPVFLNKSDFQSKINSILRFQSEINSILREDVPVEKTDYNNEL